MDRTMPLHGPPAVVGEAEPVPAATTMQHVNDLLDCRALPVSARNTKEH
jgi:hypothetical protein